MEIASIVISGLALLLSIYTYLAHGKKINNQTRIINDYRIQKIQEEKAEYKKARIVSDYYMEKKGNATIEITNDGEATAKSLEIILPDIEGLIPKSHLQSYDLKPSKSIKIPFILSEHHQEKATLTFKWSDDFSDTNTDNQEIQIT